MDTLHARPQLLKQANLSMLRKVLKAKGTATRGEIAEESGISSTTVRALLSGMLESGEIESAGYGESSGGRKAERYRFTRDRYFGAALCVKENQVHALLVNVCGEIVERARLDVADGHLDCAIFPYLDALSARVELKAIGLGVPGVVDGGGFWRKDPEDGEFYYSGIGDAIVGRYGVPVVMENDLNATAIGFGHCYEREFPTENPENTNMAYLHFERGCVSAGLIAGGRVIRGAHNFAGELGLVPVRKDRLLDDCMGRPMEDADYIEYVMEIIGWVSGILNPQYVALGGPALRKGCIGPIGDGLSSFLPSPMLPDLLYAPDMLHDYYDGMACLTAGKMFDGVQFVKG